MARPPDQVPKLPDSIFRIWLERMGSEDRAVVFVPAKPSSFIGAGYEPPTCRAVTNAEIARALLEKLDRLEILEAKEEERKKEDLSEKRRYVASEYWERATAKALEKYEARRNLDQAASEDLRRAGEHFKKHFPSAYHSIASGDGGSEKGRTYGGNLTRSPPERTPPGVARIGGKPGSATNLEIGLHLLIDGEDWTHLVDMKDITRTVDFSGACAESRLEFRVMLERNQCVVPSIYQQPAVDLIENGRYVFSGQLTEYVVSADAEDVTRIACTARVVVPYIDVGGNRVPIPADKAEALARMTEEQTNQLLEKALVNLATNLLGPGKEKAKSADAISDEEFWQRAGIPGPVPTKRLNGGKT